ncbi:MAG: Tn3 family transposase, partial [Nitrososphaerota archaeon]|nr:Tn3 family transposase [Nitrososphaerota archaeon]
MISVIAGRGMNVGLIRMASSRRHRGFTVGQLVNLDEGYVTAETLRKALVILMRAWEKRGLGQTWGTGEKC